MKRMEWSRRRWVMLGWVFVAAMIVRQGVAQEKEPNDEGVTVPGVPTSVAGPYKEAQAAARAHEWAKSEPLFRAVLEKEPGFRDARLNLGYVLARQGKQAEAAGEMDRTLGKPPTADELFLAGAILEGDPKDPATALPGIARPYFERGLNLAVKDGWLNTGDYDQVLTLAQIALKLKRQDDFKAAAAALAGRFPDHAESHYFQGIRAIFEEKWVEAEDEFLHAQAMGAAPGAIASIDSIMRQGLHGKAMPRRYGWWLVYATVAIALGLVVLFVLGKFLSFVTLSAAEFGDPNLPITPMQRRLRRAYRVVINVAGWYYYICLPFVILLALAAVGAMGYGLLMMGRIPVKLIVIVLAFGFAMLMMVWASIRSLFVRLKDDDPGRRLTAEEAPALWELTRKVASAVGTRPVDEIYLTPGTELAVFERGSWLQKARDKGRRSLILGLGVIDGFRVNDFRAVLAHEYGHFLHRDTAGGDVALRVNATMGKFAEAMARQGQLEWWNIGWQFVRLYHFLFRRITHGASRLQEINADRVAARICGKGAFEGGLKHVIRRDLLQNVEASRTAQRIERLVASGKESLLEPKPETQGPIEDDEPWWDIYARAEARRQIDKKLDEVWAAGTTEDDTHPSPVERVRLLSRLNAAADDGHEDDDELHDLFADPDKIRSERSEQVATMLKGYVEQKRLSYQQAILQIDAYLKEHPGLSDPIYQRGNVKLELRDFAGAEADFTEAIRLKGPNLGPTHFLRGRARSELGENQAAIDDFRRASELDRSLMQNALLEIGDALMQAESYGEAAAEYGRVIEETPDALNLYLRRGDAYARAGRFEDAEADYAKALELDPRCAEAYALRALARAVAGRPDDARSDADAALDIDPGIADAVPALGMLLDSWEQDS